jgi:peptidoglycan/LPS O-acetylase OafA/YrhL
VVFSHLFQRLSMTGQPGWLEAVQGAMMKGAYGVSVFFVLSGMLLSLPFWKAYRQGAAFPPIGHYVRRRAARIVPGFYASLVVSFVVSLVIFPDAPAQYLRLLAGMTFTAGFFPLTFFPTESNGPLWSISLEVFSYVLMPLFMLGLFALVKRGPLRGKRIGGWYWLLAFAVVIGLNQVVITVFTTGGPDKGWQFGQVGGAKEWLYWYNPVGFFAHFCMGICAAGVITWWAARGGRRLWRFDALAAAALVALAALVWVTRFPKEPAHYGNFQNQPYLFPAVAGVTAIALVGLAYSRVLGRIMDNRFARYTATISFGIYIWHYLILHVVSYLTEGEFEYGGVTDPWRLLAMSVVVLGLTYGVATLSWRWIERPALRSTGATR